MTTKPVQTFKLGAINAAVWENDAPFGKAYSVTFERRYKDGDRWKSTRSIDANHIMHLIKTADLAQEWIMGRRASPFPDDAATPANAPSEARSEIVTPHEPTPLAATVNEPASSA